ncbi:uncharacterized protein LOC144437269 [Glandiceps talaboti]
MYVTADETCMGYVDSNLQWHDSFDCNGILDGGDQCCGTLTNKYCCYFDSSDTGETCTGYFDSDGKWHDSFECDGLLDGGIYCCGTLTDKYCCYDADDRIAEAQLSVAIIAVIVVSIIVVVIIGIIVCICVCCCQCCRTRTTTRYVHTSGIAGTTVVTTSNMGVAQQTSIQPSQDGYAPTAAANPMLSVADFPPPAYGQAAPEYYK